MNKYCYHGLPPSIEHFQCFTTDTNAPLARPSPAQGRQRVSFNPCNDCVVTARLAVCHRLTDGWHHVAGGWHHIIMVDGSEPSLVDGAESLINEKNRFTE